jgi:hypothetical protein
VTACRSCLAVCRTRLAVRTSRLAACLWWFAARGLGRPVVDSRRIFFACALYLYMS